MLCRIDRGAAQLFSRNGREWTKKLSEQALAAAGLAVENAWLDGELVALNHDGTMSFQALQNAFDHRSDARLVYYVFDLLFFNGLAFDRVRCTNASVNWPHSWTRFQKTVRYGTATIFEEKGAPSSKRPAGGAWKG